MAEDVKILVAAHKPYWMPKDPMYLPIQVNAAANDPIVGFQRDCEGDSISLLNPRYCELTALYWGWKNLDADYIGLAHYRRHFRGNGERGILTLEEAKAILSNVPVVLPKKRRYYITDVETHYSRTFDVAHLQATREGITVLCPEYSRAFENHMRDRSGHVFNMAIMRHDYFDEYCSWLFPLLAEVEKRIDFSGMSAFEARVMGRLAERLLDPWISKNGIGYSEIPFLEMENTNWPKKAFCFARAILFNKKYSSSF